jgi:hypothetical protein
VKSWKDLSIKERGIFKEHCERIYGDYIICVGDSEPIYVDNNLNIVDNQSIINLLFYYSIN